ncbi:hypothetical protein [Sagittula sp. S175]|uniref:hypothetical protein n=1 Tax=Sagittula sp. S175 TaxID=3415129 RepID=UPI003C7B1EF9
MSLIEQIKRDREAGTPGPFHVSNGNDPKALVFSTSNGGTCPATSLVLATCHAPATRDEAKRMSRPLDSLEAAATLRRFSPVIESNARRIARLPDLEDAYIAAVEELARKDAALLAAEELARAVEAITSRHVSPATGGRLILERDVEAADTALSAFLAATEGKA